ncbi:bacteriocin immunity protein [Pectobacterium carotovorum]|uniref:bacteriocin immunity protein n=1 Tax=Pectobacterium carotovorum TaxID=554 RepID=UPI0005057DC0|nr:bacteriocin immunity protein [Pectobacterium carotovorum]KAA3667681.1 bacteriocin immunity protein [Pectobacterium carotovorum subsp. carotovorum]KFW97834.1 bacteriocin immunity protein [Pectobacterium carotovorum subsp. carotovorum]KML68156.1 bacteriocin immunity protein [Pectobacterium carotovorum subsp. carotovorum ICMP 5702]UCZ78642.1 bacteriocin immunity protein [Pectobacterium carotovorum]SHH65075.1 Pesticin immunity protein [Pectobacterium carotovorum]
MKLLLAVIFSVLMIPQTGFSATQTDALTVLKHLDVTTFRSSFGPKHFPKGTLLKDTDDYVFSQENDWADAARKDGSWTYSLRIISENEKEIIACFVDDAHIGSYFATSPFLIKKTKNAQAYSVIELEHDVEGCELNPKDQ